MDQAHWKEIEELGPTGNGIAGHRPSAMTVSQTGFLTPKARGEHFNNYLVASSFNLCNEGLESMLIDILADTWIDALIQ